MQAPYEGVEAQPDLGVTEELGSEATEPVGEPTEPQYDYLDIDSANDKYVKVTVDGEELNVPLSEALQGYSRQADYTRKTQETARMRQEAEQALAVQQALQANPGLTMQVLANQAGMSVEDYLGLSPRGRAEATAQADPLDDYADPLERALAEERQARMALEQRFESQEADRRLQSAVSGLKQVYQIGDNEARAVVGSALKMGLGPEAFPMIYQAMAYQKMQAAQQAAQQVQAQQTAAAQKRQASAASAAQTVGTGSGAVGTTSEQPGLSGNMSMREAIEAAFEESQAR